MKKQNRSNKLFFNICFDKGELKNLIAWFLDHYGEKLTVDFLEILKQVGFHQATVAGVSLGLDDLQIPDLKARLISDALIEIQLLRQKNIIGNITSVEKSQRMIDTWNQTSEILRQTTVQNFRITNPVNPIYMMAFSGARGNISQVRQLVAMRGLMADPQGAILEFPIQSNFREGLTLTEYLISCYGARKGLVDTALRTATSGYLTRRLVDAVQHVVVTMIDCGTTKGILLKDKNLVARLIGRVLAENVMFSSKQILQKNTVISPFLAKQLSLNFKEILVRSPLTCEAEKSVCQLCYGWNLAHGKVVSLGEAVGIIAAQSIGEPGTQLTMRTFHTGGVGVFSDQVTKLFTAPFEGKVEFLDKLPGRFVRTPHGNIVYMVKYISLDANRVIFQLRGQNLSFYSITEKEFPPGSLLWVKQGEFVSTGQIIAQASQIKTYKQQLPESLHPVQSPLDGEIHFELMKIVKQKHLTLKSKKRKTTETGIAPNNRTLVQLGSFWVLGAYIQKEFHMGKVFLRTGDLVSKQTPLYQYNFHLFQQGQLKKLHSALTLGFTYFNFDFSAIRFYKIGYFLNPISYSKNSFFATLRTKKKFFSKENSDLFFHKKSCTKNSKNYSLIWYPALFIVKQAGYCSLLKNYSQAFSIPSQTPFLIKEKSVLNSFEQARGILFWETQPLFFGNNFYFNTKFFNKTFLFTKTTKFLKENGLFQLQTSGDSTFKIKKFFYLFFYKNFEHKTRFCVSVVQKINFLQEIKPSSFLRLALKELSCVIFFSSRNIFLKKTKNWLFIPNNQEKKSKSFLQLRSILLEPGKNINEIYFSNKHLSLSLINSTCLQIVASEKSFKPAFFRSSLQNFKIGKFNLKKPELKTKSLQLKKFRSGKFIFYKINNQFSVSLLSPLCAKNAFFATPLRKKYQAKTETTLMLAGDLLEYRIPEKITLNQNCFITRNFYQFLRIKSPVITKQTDSHCFKKKTPNLSFQFTIPKTSTWLAPQALIHFPVNFFLESKYFFNHKHTPLQFSKSQFAAMTSTAALNLFLYDDFVLKNMSHFKFETFTNNWVLFDSKITKGFVKINQLGEFRTIKTAQNNSIISILKATDTVTLEIPFLKKKCFLKNMRVGSLIRWGDEISSNFAYHVSGQILNLTPERLNLRIGIPVLASSRGILHVFHNDLIQKNQLLITLKSRRFQTEDIVQGIPKIEQLFEARETQGGELITNSVHTKLQNLFVIALQSQNVNLAVLESVKNIQNFLIENILEAYANQGVKISEKHVEIIVRQMTTRVRIIVGGDTGLLPGELVQLTWIHELNKTLQLLGYRQATYEPIVLGITKSVLQSESFLLAASFQEVSRVLVRSALSKKTDFLRGLHENVILGQLIPAGTGLLTDRISREVSELNFQLPF